jgi:hypothetical protein
MACVEALALVEDCGIKNLTVIKNIKETTRCPYMMMLEDLKVSGSVLIFCHLHMKIGNPIGKLIVLLSMLIL